jgi:hypothetical protein
MGKQAPDNLVQIGKLKAEAASRKEFEHRAKGPTDFAGQKRVNIHVIRFVSASASSGPARATATIKAPPSIARPQ